VPQAFRAMLKEDNAPEYAKKYGYHRKDTKVALE
jgi:hypothetical protein